MHPTDERLSVKYLRLSAAGDGNVLSYLDKQHRYIFDPLKSIGIKAIESSRTTRPSAGFATRSPQDPEF